MAPPSPLVATPSLSELIHALTRGDIRASFRPVVHLGTGAAVGWEAVGRWDVQSRGVLREPTFLPIADRGQVRHLVEAAVLERALGELVQTDRTQSSRPTMSVAVSVGSILAGETLALLDDLLGCHDVSPSRLFIEVGGPIADDVIAPLGEQLERVRDLGVRVTLTDVACGDHAFTKLRLLPLDRVQLGSCCVSGIDGPREQAIVRAVIALARELAIDVVADGITDAHHEGVLRRLGCKLGTGTYFGEHVPFLQPPIHHEAPARVRRSHPMPANEVARLGMVYETGLLDTPDERVFDDIAHAAAEACDTPIALVTLVDVDRVWFKATVGSASRQAERGQAFCAHTICEPGPLVVDDTSVDPRFGDHPLVAGPAGIAFYAGVPLLSTDGNALGTVCVMDHQRRHLEPEQLAALERLAAHAASEIELRARLHQLDRARQAAAAAERTADELRQAVSVD
ncbi:MAG: EAL domain-containing protein [Acidimicrobiales bacterium]